MLSTSKKGKRTDKEVSLGEDEISEASFDGYRPVDRDSLIQDSRSKIQDPRSRNQDPRKQAPV